MQVTYKFNVFTSTGKFKRVDTVTKTDLTQAQANELVKRLNWLNENRKEAGKYFAIEVK